MANSGIEVYGDSGIYQIDNTYTNLCLRSKGTITTDTTLFSGTPVTYKSIGYASGYTTPVICVGGTVLAQPETFYNRSTGQYGFTISAAGPIGTVVPYWIFDVPVGPGTSHAGMQVWSAAGVLIYDTDWPPMRVVGFVQNSGAGTLFTGASGKTYAVIHSIRGFRAVTVENLFVNAMMTSVSAAGVVTASNQHVATIPSSPTQVNIRNITAIILDVTNQ